ncbi:hypothetical protein CLOM_g23784 [Closterium sp. NIES-68]|nr:hypothetical protein CLOM_g23784 [Closterium sp. NIES-68]GJP66859.1 hypothetical protein CLOP_g23744 [Closterium sp. NIES-67]
MLVVHPWPDRVLLLGGKAAPLHPSIPPYRNRMHAFSPTALGARGDRARASCPFPSGRVLVAVRTLPPMPDFCICLPVSHASHPQVVIMLVVHAPSDRVLLGRQHRFPDGMWSCLAGFMEPGESLEEAVAREVGEEVGLPVTHTRYHSSQPWPVGFGSMQCQLMVGFFAFVEETSVALSTHELQDARWFTRHQVAAALSFEKYETECNDARRKMYMKLVPHASDDPPLMVENKPNGHVYVPGPYAIAHHLIATWARDKSIVDGHSCL